MSKAILVMGESGSGKTTAMRNLPPSETYYIDCDGKGLAWKGWRSQYNSKNKNYANIMASADDSRPGEVADSVIQLMKAISDKRTDIKYIVLDTINALMVYAEMLVKSKGYQKWSDLAEYGYKIALISSRLRDDITVIVLGHSETITDENTGQRFTRLKTNGRKLEKLVLESLFPTVIWTDKTVNEEGKIRHIFILEHENATAKLPLGAIEETETDNDIMIIIKALEDY